MNKKFVIGVGVLLLAGAGWFAWSSREPYGNGDILWTVLENQGEGVEISYHPGGAPLDVQSEFLPIAKDLCKVNSEAVLLQAFKATGKNRADFFRVSFHYGKGQTDFFLYATFVLQNGKVNCDVIYNGKQAVPSPSTPKGI